MGSVMYFHAKGLYGRYDGPEEGWILSDKVNGKANEEAA